MASRRLAKPLFFGAWHPIAGASILSLATTLAACTPDAGDTKLVERAGAIIHGTDSSFGAKAVGEVVVQANTAPFTFAVGSGTLLTNEWVLTAAHVVDKAISVNAVTVGFAGETPVVASEVRIHPLYTGTSNFKNTATGAIINPWLTNNVDIALIHLSSPLNTAATYDTKVSNQKAAQLVGQTVTCYGYGRQQFGVDPSPRILTSGLFTLQALSSGWSTNFRILTNATNQIPDHGDSGGACLMGTPGLETVVGVNKGFVAQDCIPANNQCPIDPSTGTRAACISVNGQNICDYHTDMNLQAAQSFDGFVRAVMRRGADGTLTGQPTSDRLTVNVDPTTHLYQIVISYANGTEATIPTLIADPTGKGEGLAQIEVSDLDGDGRPDIIFLLQGRDPVLQTLQSFAFFLPGAAIADPANPAAWTNAFINLFAPGANLVVRPQALYVEVADNNQDGHSDLVVVNGDGTNDVFLGTGSGLATEAVHTVSVDVTGDGSPDFVTFSRGTGNVVHWSSRNEIQPAAGDPPVPWVEPVQAFPADLNGDGAMDFLVISGGRLFPLIATRFGGFVGYPATAADPKRVFTRIDAALDANGLPFVEAYRQDGVLEIFRSFSNLSGGLVGSERYMGFPTADGGDGKMLVATGPGRQTLLNPISTFRIVSTQTSLKVEAFDADYSGWNDLVDGSMDLCFLLWTDACGNGAGDCESPAKPPRLVTAVNGSRLAAADNAWATIFSNNNVADALHAQQYTYALDAVLMDPSRTPGQDVCTTYPFTFTGVGDAAAATIPGWNGYKVRANGTLGVRAASDTGGNAVTVIAVDSSGNHGPAGISWMPPTRFDGTFDFYFPVGSAVLTSAAGIRLDEADADSLLNTEYPGVADGANDLIMSWLVAPDGQFADLEQVTDFGNIDDQTDDTFTPIGPGVGIPSGNYSPEADAWSLQEYKVISPEIAGNWNWHWDGVWVHNVIYIWAPQASPVGYDLMGGAAERSFATSATPRSSWASTPDSIGSFLPIVIGQTQPDGTLAGSSVRVSTASAAVGILSGSPTALRDQIAQELLAAKLNLARAGTQHELLNNALVYGATVSVNTVVKTADEMVRGPFELVASTAAQDTLVLLRAINAGQLTFDRPGVQIAPGIAGRDDTDGDGVPRFRDNCPSIANPDQRDSNRDGIGDACHATPVLDCVLQTGSSSYLAYLGYENPLPYRYIPIGATNGFSGVQDRGQPTELRGSQHRAFAVPFTGSSPFTWSLDGQSVTVSASGPRCTGSELLTLPFAKDVALLAAEDLVLRDGVPVTTSTGALAAVVSGGPTELGAGARVREVWSRGNVWVRSNAVVQQSLVTGGTVDRQQGATIGGPIVEHGYVAPPALGWTVSFPGSNRGAVNIEPGTPARSIDPGAYGDVTVKGSALILRSGVYQFESLSIEPTATLTLNQANGPVVIYVRSGLTHKGSITSQQGGLPDLLLGYFGTQTAFIEAAFTGDLIAPNAQVVLGRDRGGLHQGRFFARRLEVRAGATVKYVE